MTPIRVCAEPGCPELTEKGSKCDDHRKIDRARQDARRPSAGDRGYGTAWRKVRRIFLNDNPICVLCGADSKVPDHYPKTRRELVAEGVSNPDDSKYLRPLCISCHNSETAKAQASNR